MLIHLIPPSPHPAVLYALTFPSILPLQSLGPGATIPASWSSQLQIITSFLQLEPPSSIHMLDRAVGLVARTREVSMDIPQKEIVVEFVDGRVANIPMSSDCIQMLLGVVHDVKGCSEPEIQRDSMESSACPGSMAGSAEDVPSEPSPTKSSRFGKHKRQRSLLFSLISANSSLVPKSLSSSTSSSSSPSPPPTAPPPSPLPPLPATGRVTPVCLKQTCLSSEPDPDMLRRRARATLVDVWRRHVVSALSSLHLPAAGYAEWTLIAMASKVQAEIESVKTARFRSHDFGVSNKRSGGGHRRAQSEGRNALDYGDRRCDYGFERYRAPSPFPGMMDTDDVDRVVYPRRDQADEWGVRYVDRPRSFGEADVFAVELNCRNDSLFGEDSMVGGVWDDHERVTFELDRLGRHGTGIDVRLSSSGHSHLHPTDLGSDLSDDDGSRLADTAFDMSRTPLVPFDVNDDEELDDLLRTPEEEELPLSLSVHTLRGPAHFAARSASQSPSVSRVTSSRPRSRNTPDSNSSAPSKLEPVSHSPVFPAAPPPSVYDLDFSDGRIDEITYSRHEHLDRLCSALEIVRGRAREEGWRLVRATMAGDRNGWVDTDTEGALELKAKRRAWSSGIKIYAPYSSTSCSRPKARTSGFWTPRSPTSPPGLASFPAGVPRMPGPIVPTGLSLGIPLRSSPLAVHARDADNEQRKHSELNSVRGIETIEGKRPARVTFADCVTKLFPVCEDDEDPSDPVQVGAVGFPQTVPLAVSTDEPEVVEASATNDDPFHFCPPRPRTRTKSMHIVAPTPLLPPAVLPMVRPSTPPPSYQVAVGGTVSPVANDEGRLDASALLLQPLSSLAISPPSQLSPLRPPLTSNPPFVPRPRAVSLPATGPFSGANKARHTSLNPNEHCEDLTRTYASPPPEGPLVISAAATPHEQYPRYAHIQSPLSADRKGIHAPILGRKSKEVVFEQAGSEFTVGLEIALGRAEEGRVVW